VGFLNNLILKNTLEAISEAYKCGKITLENYNKMLSVIQYLNDYFIDTYNSYKGLSEEQVEKFFKERVSKYEHNLFANYIKESHVCNT